MSRFAQAVLSTENLIHNVETLKQLAPNSHMIAMVKANAYGHGLRSVAQRLRDRVSAFGVASIDEALIIRKLGIHTPIILIEGVFEPAELTLASQANFTVVIHNELQLDWLANCTYPLQCWLKIDTGLGRLGFAPETAITAYKRLIQYPQVAQPITILSHFACANQPDHPLHQKQIKVFQQLKAELLQLDPRLTFSLCNSAAIFTNTEKHDYIRPGLALYGGNPFFNFVTDATIKLKPVMTVSSKIIAIKELAAGQSIGYGGSYICKTKTRIGIVAFGYGDGYPRNATTGTPVLVNKQIAPVVGRVSMDMLAINLNRLPQAQLNDLVILWGEQLPIEYVAYHSGHSNYDLMTGIQNRVKFSWT